MKFLIVQPCWDHTEILGALLYYIKEKNHELKILYDWSHPEGNYLDYYCELFGFGDDVKFNYKSPKFHVKDFQKADRIIFVDEIHLRKFMSKGVYREMEKKLSTFNHITKRVMYNEMKILTLGVVPFRRCRNETKYLTNSYYNPGNVEKIVEDINEDNFKIKKFLVIGNPSQRRIDFLENLVKYNNWEIYVIVRGDYNKTHKNVILLKDLGTKDLIELLKKVHYVITLFNKNSYYHNDRISGIVPFAISFGIPLLTDDDYVKKSEIKHFREFVYINEFSDFKSKFENCLKITFSDYKKKREEILEYRNHCIIEQYLNYGLIFE